jgi:hypothetical protein
MDLILLEEMKAAKEPKRDQRGSSKGEIKAVGLWHSDHSLLHQPAEQDAGSPQSGNMQILKVGLFRLDVELPA